MTTKETLFEICKKLIFINKNLMNFIELEIRFKPDAVDAFIELSKLSDKEMIKHERHSFWRERTTKQEI